MLRTFSRTLRFPGALGAKAPLSARLRRLAQSHFSKRRPGGGSFAPRVRERTRNLWLMHSGILATVFGACFATIPLYRLFCQKVGLEGDLEQKDYSRMPLSNVGFSRKFRVRFRSETDPDMQWSFEPETRELEVHAGETALAFYKVKNLGKKPVIGIATYTLVPEYAANYFAKVQCFCFNQQMVNAGEELFLPLYFYLEPEIAEERKMEGVFSLTITYKFFPCREQGLAELVQAQTVRELRQKQFILGKRLSKASAAPEQLALWREEFESNREFLEALGDAEGPLISG